MSKLDDLHTLVRLLKEFELPVSPILEYAIEEKIEQLSLKDESPVVKPVGEVQENDGMLEVSVKTTAGTKKKPQVLRIIRANGTIIECKKEATAFCQAIKEIGAENVYWLKIPWCNTYLVTVGGNPQHPTDLRDIGNGYFVNIHSGTRTKKRQLERIFKALKLSWKVEIVESK